MITPRRVVAAAAAAIVTGAALTAGAPPAGAVPPLPAAGPTQELAVMLTAHGIKATLNARGSRATLPASAPITGAPTVVPVIGHATRPGGIRWLKVMLPGRPNGSTGWITQRGTQQSTTSWRVSIRTATRSVRVYRRGRLVRSFAAVVGKPSTPTPNGRFFVEESILMPRGSAGAPYALALSARSNVLQEFEGGPGQIALHGVANLGGTPGTAISHGCVRLADADIRWLAAHISPGVRVTVTA
jgi:lipoprotein-anchoring transpeptidase ErfK/SrfK